MTDGKSIADQLAAFEYTQAEGESVLAALGTDRRAWAVKQHGSEKVVLDWLTNFSRQYLTRLFLIKSKGVSHSANEILKRRMDATRKMAEKAQEMLELEKEHHLISEFSRYDRGFYETPKNRDYDPNTHVYVPPAEAFVATLKSIATDWARVLAQIPNDKAELWNDIARSPRFLFVGMLAHFWEDFSGEEMGTGPGGPAAEFVSACFLPLDRLWKKEVGESGGPDALSVEAAGKAILRAMKDKKASYISKGNRTPDR
jgi:hypothetical protein